MTVQIQMRGHRGATVVTLAGLAEGGVLTSIRDALAAAMADADLVVLELDLLTLIDPTGLRAVLADLLKGAPPVRLCIVTRRGTTLALLVHWRVHEMLPVHRSVDDAVVMHRARGGDD